MKNFKINDKRGRLKFHTSIYLYSSDAGILIAAGYRSLIVTSSWPY